MSCLRDVYFWRQSLVLIGDSLHSVGTGFMLSYSSVLNPALLSPNATDIRATPEDVSWISASLGFAGVLGFFIIPPFFQHFGRKSVHIFLNSLMTVGFLVFFYANSVKALYVGKFIQGVATCSVTITVIIIAEYSHPKRRGYFMTFKKASASLGSLICHSLYFSLTWRQIALVATIPYGLSNLLIHFWPESPAYLAMKGRYDECDESHTWLFGDSTKAKKDLDELIRAQTERRSTNKKTAKDLVKRILGKFVRKEFVKPLLIATLLIFIIDASGRYYMMMYVIDILVEITEDTSTAVYCSIAADLFTILALALSGFIVRLLTRRSMLLYFGLATTTLMYVISLLIFLKSKYNIGTDLIWLIPSIIVLNSFLSYVSIIPTSYTVISEIFPLEHKGLASFATGVMFTSSYSVTVKLIPTMISKLGVEGMYAIFATCLLLCIIGLHFVFIETKDRTLQDIEDEIKGVKRTELKLLESSPLGEC